MERFVLERCGTDVDPEDAALQGEERATAATGVQRRGVGDDAVASSNGIRSADRSDGRDDRCLRTAGAPMATTSVPIAGDGLAG